MIKACFFVISGFLLFSGCASKPPDLNQQLQTNFTEHLKRLDSTVVLDSFRIIRVDTMVQKLGRIIDDTLYRMELHRVEAQLANAILAQRPDSAAFYREEIDYMKPQIDSLTKSIAMADTTVKLGVLIICTAQIRKNDQTREQQLYYFLDQHMVLQDAERMDSEAAKTIRSMR